LKTWSAKKKKVLFLFFKNQNETQLKVFHTRLSRDVNNFVQTKLCSYLSVVDSGYITGLIDDLNKELIGFISPKPPLTPPLPFNVDLADLQNNSVINLVEFILQRVLGPHGLNNAIRIVNISSFDLDLSSHRISFPILGFFFVFFILFYFLILF
jgi:hypothetical protein